MPVVSIDSFLPEIAPLVPGCPEPVMKNALVSAAIEFCDRSLFWQERLLPVSVTSGSFPYDIPTPDHGRLSRVMSAHAGQAELHPTSYEALDRSYDWDTKTGEPSHYLVSPDSRLLLYPLPTAAVDLRMTVAYRPTKDATEIEQVLFDRWVFTLASGALKLLYAMPDKGWSKPDLVAWHANRFETGTKLAFVEASTTNMARGGMRVTPRPFA